MVPTRFAWPYGGRQVFLSGSFTRWTEHFPMTPVEGSSLVFQAICNLAPGYHQYKFLVDGVWRLDENQAYVTDEYGMVNNIILVKELELAPSILCSEPVPSKSGMDVDNGNFQQSASLSGGTEREPVLQISESDIDVSRCRLSVLLSRCTAYELLPNSGKVFAVDVKLPVKQAFHIMYEQGLAVVPIWDDSKGQLSGMLTSSDFILILKELHNNVPMLANEELEMHPILSWKEGKLQLHRKSDGTIQPSFRRPLIQVSPQESLKDVALKILQNKISTVPIIHSSQHGLCQQLLHLACLPGILKYICRHFRHSPGMLPLLQNPVGRLRLGTWAPDIGIVNAYQLTTLQPNAPLSSVLDLLIEADISSIPIVDANGCLLDQFSRSDITSLAKGSAYAHIRLDQTSIHQALQLVYKACGPLNAYRRCQTCLRYDSLLDIMERLSDPVVRRLIVIEAGSKRVEGIISLSDVFNFLLG
ncbi:sucrose nonfermenting 4-like protein [Macadamia integrifolia]|uniref:sucrose nonfermenting 4-like protein n=1 Tax=Macadamia integrifolia TaxID=60698 RepID=UPI001C4F70F5|nr:sucrose nonfermenting 4-like protein [Macadamia integrifolia]